MPTNVHVLSSFRDPGVRRILLRVAIASIAVAVLCALGAGVALAGSSRVAAESTRLVAPSCPLLSAGPNVSLGFSSHLPHTFGSVHAPPFTRLGFGSFHTKGRISFGGFNGVCSAGTIHTINLYLDRHLRLAGFQFSVPPRALRQACGLSGKNFWTQRGSSFESFSWHFHRSVKNGEVWGYHICDP